ncbi:odorant receptor 67a-like [Pieris rapae]|uniref:odorant receptor 67a-like n=1 Tax=Pieris rapae TaxID=64459 RepID=UPI001E27E1A8|nr:odorant receptor 67a-like [Pieris rapae]
MTSSVVPFWVVSVGLLTYVYVAGNVMFQMKFAKSPGDYIKSNVNVLLLLLTYNNCYWWLRQSTLLKKVLKQVKENDRLAKESAGHFEIHEKLLSVVKKIIVLFYGSIWTDAVFIYLPNRVDISNNHYCMTPCVGMEPLSATPNRQICKTILFIQEVILVIIDLNYQTLQLLLISHTATMYRLLAEEMQQIDAQVLDENHYQEIKKKLPLLIVRHVLTLDIIKNLQSLYSFPMGVNFALNTVCIALFFYLPTEEWIDFCPFLIYCFFVFFLYCYLCQKLIDASEMFERSVYACGWEKYNIREMKIVYIIMLQAQKPIELLAADIIPINIYTFATTIQFLYKFITIVKF